MAVVSIVCGRKKRISVVSMFVRPPSRATYRCLLNTTFGHYRLWSRGAMIEALEFSKMDTVQGPIFIIQFMNVDLPRRADHR